MLAAVVATAVARSWEQTQAPENPALMIEAVKFFQVIG
jgi:hypothetical protein